MISELETYSKERVIKEPERTIPIVKEVDVVINGGGPAGLVAAIASVRNGVKTILIERYGFLGGMATAGLVRVLSRFFLGEKQVIGGIPWEVVQRMAELGGADPAMHSKVFGCIPFDAEVFKYVANEMISEAGADMLLHSFAVDVLKSNNEIAGVIVENKSGRQAILAKVIIDATGDGDIAARAGAPFEKGRASDGAMLPMTLVFRLGNVDIYQLEKMWAHVLDEGHTNLRIRNLMKKALEEGILPPFGGPWIRIIETQNKLYVNTVRCWGDATNVEDLTKAEIKARRDVWKFFRFLKENVPELANCNLAETATQIGLRETRRVMGDYVLTKEDIEKNTLFPDVIALGAHPIDIHSPDGTTGQILIWSKEAYGIPYRCLVPKGIENLLVAGRCISVTHEAHASTRVMGTCMAIGQAAGTAAALAVKSGVKPRNLAPQLLQEKLIKQGAILGKR